jgi:MoxR-like ATPase
VDIAGGNGLRNIKIHHDCVFIATANIGAEYTGTSQMDRALVDRFFMQEIEYMDAENEAKVLSKRCGIDTSDAKIIVETARTVRSLYSKGEVSSTLSTRETLGAGRMVADGWSVLEAMERNFLPFFEGTKTEGERGVVYKTFLRH